MNKVKYIVLNRLSAIFAAWGCLLLFCAFFSHNANLNGAVLFFGFLWIVCGFGYVMDSKPNAQERLMIRKFNAFVNEI